MFSVMELIFSSGMLTAAHFPPIVVKKLDAIPGSFSGSKLNQIPGRVMDIILFELNSFQVTFFGWLGQN